MLVQRSPHAHLRIAAVALLGGLLWPAEAHLSRVHYRSISLEQLLQWSTLVVVATPAGARRATEIDIGSGAPAFGYAEHPFRVTEVLKGSLQDKEKAELWVAGANLGRRFSLHKRYYLDKVSKSPIYDSYEAKKDPGEGARVLFLRRTEFEGKPKVVYTVMGAEEHADQRAAIKALMKTAKP